MSKKSTLYFHIGLAKTGSTYLQQNIFPNIKSIQFINKPELGILTSDNSWDGTFCRFFKRSPTVWEDLGDHLFEKVFGPPGEAVRRSPTVLLSDENACTGCLPDLLYQHLVMMTELSRRWGFSKLRLLGSVRHQATFLASAYAQTSDRLRGASQADFEDSVRSLISVDAGYHLQGVAYDYNRLYDSCARAVGEENVIFLPFELMKEDRCQFLKAWLKFMGCEDKAGAASKVACNGGSMPKNVRSHASNAWKLRPLTDRNYRVIELPVQRIWDKLGLPKKVVFRTPDLKRENEIYLTPEVYDAIVARYAESNRQLSEQIGFDLKKYGYY